MVGRNLICQHIINKGKSIMAYFSSVASLSYMKEHELLHGQLEYTLFFFFIPPPKYFTDVK
jgi:hypothetical protein